MKKNHNGKANETLISIIIPVYNVEDYLEKCIQSIIIQTYRNLEIILVNDGSKDNCGNICDEYAKKDKRIRVIHKENGGLSDARNVGIEVAKGKYIAFIDSDDYVSEDYIQYMYDMLIKNHARLAICGVKEVWKNTKVGDEVHTKTEVLSPKEVFENLLLAKGIRISAYAKLYDKELWKAYRFPKNRVYEDTAIIHNIIEDAKTIVYGDKECYYYIARVGSISKHFGFNKNEEDYIEYTQKMLSYIQQRYPDLETAIHRFDVYSKFRILRMLIYTQPRNKEMEKEYIAGIKKYQKEILTYKQTPKRDKMAILLLNLGLPIFKATWGIYCKYTGRI